LALHLAPHTLGYACPDPNMIAASANRRNAWLVTWLSRRDASYFYAISKDNLWVGEQASLQAWKAVLSNRLDPGKSPSTSNNTPAGKKSALARRKARLNKDATDFFTAAGLSLGKALLEVMWNGGTFPVHEPLPNEISTQVLWELFENNFRLELLRLDCYLMRAEWEVLELQDVRENLVKLVFFWAF
ncbi:hypothetical protein H0H93_015395, partial [Arthromyces matolae]